MRRTNLEVPLMFELTRVYGSKHIYRIWVLQKFTLLFVQSCSVLCPGTLLTCLFGKYCIWDIQNILYIISSGPPTVSMNIPSSHYLCNNSLLSLSCRTSATPQTTATSWYHNSKFLSTGDSLLLLPLSTAEEGYYQCFAQNQLGSGSDASLLRFPIGMYCNTCITPELGRNS